MKNPDWRPQPPHIEDPETGDAELDYLGREDDDVLDDSDENPTASVIWLKRARDAYQFSTSYIDNNYRKNWEISLNHFHSRHAADAKYHLDAFKKRSQIFRPKTRAVIRKNEAAAAAAFFSNLDYTSVLAQNPDDPEERMAADVMKEILQYRLTHSIPWFQTLIGGLQDAQILGCACAHVYWRYQANGEEVVEDRPVVDLLPIENLRFDPAAHWVDPVNTSPYLIHLIPMYLCDVQDRMRYPDPKGRTWKTIPARDCMTASDNQDDPTRAARLGRQEDPTQGSRRISDYDLVWVHRHIHRSKGRDYEFYTIGSRKLLTDPEPLTQTVFHGRRPYVVGTTMLETHKVVPTSLPVLIKGLQDESNEIGNQRLDNIKFALNKRWFAKRGSNVDLASLVRNAPGSITLLDNLDTDVKEVSFPDVTQSAYIEQDRINADLDELAGNFSASSLQQQQAPNQPARSVGLLQAPANLLTEYVLKTFVETFASPVLRHLMALERHYETDVTLLSLAGRKAQVFKKYGVSELSDEILDKELDLTINVGFGASDPNTRLQKFIYGLTAFSNLALRPPAGLNLQEIAKELFSLTGYQGGERFFFGQDPDKIKMAQQIQQLMKILQQAGSKLQDRTQNNLTKLQTTRETNAARLAIAKLAHPPPSDSTSIHATKMVEIELEHHRKVKALELEHQRRVAELQAELGLREKIAEHERALGRARFEREAHTPKPSEPTIQITNVMPKGRRNIKVTRGENGLVGEMTEE